MNKNLMIRFSYENLRNETHVEYHDTASGVMVRYNIAAAFNVQALYDAYYTAFMDETNALDIIFKSGYTADIEAADHARDLIFRGLSDAVKSNLNHFDEGKRNAARKVENVLEHYGNIAAKSFDQETAAIDDLLRELNSSCAAEIAFLQLADWTEKLAMDNSAFKTLMNERYSETANRPATRMKTARTATDKAFRALLDRIDALATVNGAETYQTFANELNAVSERYKNQLAQAAGKHVNKTAE